MWGETGYILSPPVLPRLPTHTERTRELGLVVTFNRPRLHAQLFIFCSPEQFTQTHTSNLIPTRQPNTRAGSAGLDASVAARSVDKRVATSICPPPALSREPGSQALHNTASQRRVRFFSAPPAGSSGSGDHPVKPQPGGDGQRKGRGYTSRHAVCVDNL